MYKKIALAGISLSLLASPFFASADTMSDLQLKIQALMAQIAQIQQAHAPTPPTATTSVPDDYGTGDTDNGVYCPKLSATLQKGSRDATTGGQVTELQTFLTDYYNLDENVVVGGYFGNVTQRYVVQFQSENGLPTAGIVGSLSRAKIASICGGGMTPSPSASVDLKVNGSDGPLTVLKGQRLEVTWSSTLLGHCDISGIESDLGGKGTQSREPNGNGTITESYTSYERTINLGIVCVDGAKGQTTGSDHVVITVGAPSQHSSLQVTAPNGGERFVKAGIFSAKWRLSGRYPAGTKVCVNLTNQATQINNVPFYGTTGTEHCAAVDSSKDTQEGMVSGQLGQGPLTTNWLPAGMYKVRAFTTAPSNEYKPEFDVFDESDAPFYIADSSAGSGITVTAPNGGEQWEEGVLNSITWTPYGYNPDVNPSRDVNAYLETKNADGSFNVIGSVIPSGKASIHWLTGFRNDGYHEGMVPPGTGFYIRTVNTKTGASDRSDSSFTILPQPIKLQVNGVHTPVTVAANQTVNLSWQAATGLTKCYLGGSISTPGGQQMYVSNTGTATVPLNFFGQVQGVISLNCTQAPVMDGDQNAVGPAYGTIIADTVSILLSGATQPVASVQVSSPNGGEQFNPSNTMNVTFNYSGVSTYSAGLYKNDQWKYWITKDQPLPQQENKGAINWIPSASLTGLGTADNAGAIFKIYITGQKTDGTGYVDDKSDAPFSFSAPSTASAVAVFVSTDASTPSFQTVQGGATNVMSAVYKFRATGDNVNLSKLGLRLTSGSSGDLVLVRLYNAQGTQIGSTVFTGTAAVSTLSSPLYLQKDTDVAVYVRVDYSNIGINQSGVAGDIIKIDVDAAASQGTAINSGSSVIPSGSSAVAGMQLVSKSPCPLYQQLACPTGQHLSVGTPTTDANNCQVPHNSCVQDVVLAPKKIFLASGTSWTVPSDWNSSNNKIEVIGGGGDGAVGYQCGGGAGGGGAYSQLSNLALPPGAQVTYRVGTGGNSGGYGASGGNTWFGAATYGAAPVSAQGGLGGVNDTPDSACVVHNGGLGGQASNGNGAIRYSGGWGGSSGYGGGGGGGAAGSSNAGGNGGSYGGGNYSGGAGGGGANGYAAGASTADLSLGANGGNGWQGNGGGVGNCVAGTNGGGGSGGNAGSCGGGAGGMDTSFDASHGAGGGGGGGGAGSVWPAQSTGRAGGPGATYGGGGGGGDTINAVGGAGAPGIIVITYTPISVTSVSRSSQLASVLTALQALLKQIAALAHQ